MPRGQAKGLLPFGIIGCQVTSLAGQSVRDGEGLPLREAVEIRPFRIRHQCVSKSRAIWQVGPCVTKKVQALLLATFHSMTAVDFPLVVEGH